MAKKNFTLEAMVDFVDDALIDTVSSEPISVRHVEAMMRTLAEAGVRRVSWAYYGDGRGGYLMPANLPARAGDRLNWAKCAQVYSQLGNPLRAAATAAHRHGIEIFAYFKPYETGPGILLPTGSPEAREAGRLEHKGSSLTWMDPFVLQHPHLRIRHRDEAAPERPQDRPIAALRLTKKDAAPTRVKPERLQIWTSDANYRYRRSETPFTCTESVGPSPSDVRDIDGRAVVRRGDPVRVFDLSGLNLTAPYVLVTTDFADGPADFENIGTDLLIALDADGRAIPGVLANGRGVWFADRIDFREWGLMFDWGWTCAPMFLDEPNASGKQGLIAFCRGRNPYLPGALCETEPEVQSFWLDCVGEMLDAGVDGIDLREENHSTHTDYPDEYGFNPEVLRRTGGNADPTAVAAVRGEAYTDFIRAMKKAISDRGKRLRVNLNLDWFRPDPPGGRAPAYPLNIDFDWRTWIDRGLADEALLRFFQTPFDRVFDDSVAAEMIDRCQRRGVPLTVNRYAQPAPQYVEEFSRVERDGRFAGFVLYETANFLTYTGPDECVMTHDGVRQVVERYRRRG